eukprot:scaffold39409_cov31-Tisochrysis_lutea.AAC.1
MMRIYHPDLTALERKALQASARHRRSLRCCAAALTSPLSCSLFLIAWTSPRYWTTRMPWRSMTNAAVLWRRPRVHRGRRRSPFDGHEEGRRSAAKCACGRPFRVFLGAPMYGSWNVLGAPKCWGFYVSTPVVDLACSCRCEPLPLCASRL